MRSLYFPHTINMNRLRKSITYLWTKTRKDSRQILITEFHPRLRLRWVKYKSNIYIYKNLTCMVEKGFFIINTSLKRTSPYKASCTFMVTYVILFLKYSGNLCCGVRLGTRGFPLQRQTQKPIPCLILLFQQISTKIYTSSE